MTHVDPCHATFFSKSFRGPVQIVPGNTLVKSEVCSFIGFGAEVMICVRNNIKQLYSSKQLTIAL